MYFTITKESNGEESSWEVPVQSKIRIQQTPNPILQCLVQGLRWPLTSRFAT